MSDRLGNFERLAEKRVNEALKKIRLIGNLSNKKNYEYTDQHAQQIIDALDAELKGLKLKFKNDESTQGTFMFLRSK